MRPKPGTKALDYIGFPELGPQTPDGRNMRTGIRLSGSRGGACRGRGSMRRQVDAGVGCARGVAGLQQFVDTVQRGQAL